MSDRRLITPPRSEEDPGSDRAEMRIGFGVSVALHSTILALLVFGIPITTSTRPAIEQIVPVDFVTIAEKPAAPKIEPPKPPPPKPPEPPKEAKQEPPAPIPAPSPPPPPPPQETKQPDPPKVEPPKPEPPKPPDPPKIVEAPKVEPPKPPPPKPPEPKKVEAPKPQPKPEPKKEQKKQDDWADQLMKTLEKPKAPAQQLTPPQPRAIQPPPPQTALNYAQQLTATEMDGVRDQFRPCWNPNFGGRNAQDLVVDIEIWANPDGTIMKAQPRQNLRMESDPFYASARDAAMRAVLNQRCVGVAGLPLKLPREKYEQWKFFVFAFNPKEM